MDTGAGERGALGEKTVLVGAPIGPEDQRRTDEHLEELGRLADTAGAKVVAVVRQRLQKPDARYYIGKGKARELEEVSQRHGAELVIFDEELKPDQAKSLEDLLGVRVMDRSELILDIFASRARTREAKLQVELAQLQYLLPRLKRMWTHLSRTRGGIGLRGPGETQLETDRRLIGTRIAELRKKLEAAGRAEATRRQGRAREFRVALVGYTNAGKSSLLKALSGDDLFVEDRLFATLDPATRAIDLGEGHQALLTDTVGFIRKLPHHLVASFRSTLEEAREADLILHVVDASHEEWEEQSEVVDQVLADLELDGRPQVTVFNKLDRLTHAEEKALRERIRGLGERSAVFTSAHDPRRLAELEETLRARLRAQLSEVRVRVPAEDGETLARLHREGEVLEMNGDGGGIDVTARVRPDLVGRLRKRRGVRVHADGPPSPDG